MDPTKGILVKTFGNIADADLAAGQLRSHGIECVIKTDDCAGMYPSLGVIQLLVDPETVDDARKFLNEPAPTLSAFASLPDETTPVPGQPIPPRVFRFNSGLVIGLIVGAVLQFSYAQHQKYRDRTDRYDDDQDGSIDQEVVWRNGKMLEWRRDRNADSRWDEWTFYRDELPWRGEADNNFDGHIDAWFTYSARAFLSRAELDTDYNGIRDVGITYTNDVIVQSDWQPNGGNVVVLRQLFRQGMLDEELRDLNGDGWFDVSIKFDPFNTPIRTNNLRPTTQSP